MNICEAVKEAVRDGKYISLPWGKDYWKIQPIASEPCSCIIIGTDRTSAGGWQPTADDLMNEEWMIVD